MHKIVENLKNKFPQTARYTSVAAAWLTVPAVPLFFIISDLILYVYARHEHSIYWARVFPAIRMAYNFNTITMPLIFLAAAGIIMIVLGRHREERGLRNAAAILALAGLCCAGARVYATHIEPHCLHVRQVRIETAKVDRPLRILHISDIQSDRVGSYEEKVFGKIRELDPDLILYTGDLLDPLPPANMKSELPKMAGLLRTLKPPLGLYGVYGDVDEWLYDKDPDDLGGLRNLENEQVIINRGGLTIRIFGLSLWYSALPKPALKMVEPWFTRTGPEELTIILGHRPDYIAGVNRLSIDLCLAGHTHGGQIRIPFKGPLITGIMAKLPWASGLHEIGKTRINISAGIGTEHAAGLPAIRVNCPPEMTLIELVPANTAKNQQGPDTLNYQKK